MKKTLIKLAVLLLVFVLTVLVAEKIMNTEQDNITMEMESATFPVVTMVHGDYKYNELHGFALPQDVSYIRDSLTVLGENRDTGFHIDTYGQTVNGISIELRTSDGSRLIEDGELKDYRTTGWSIDGTLTLKDLIEKNENYSLTLKLALKDGEEDKEIYFYTTVIWNGSMELDRKLDFVQDFHDKLFDKEAAVELKKYLETNSALNDNSTFSYVDIHSSFKQITYGDLEPVQLDEPTIFLKDITDNTASILLKYVVFTGEGGDRVYYLMEEYYRIRIGSERMLLLDYQRKMEQYPDIDTLCQNDKIVLGIRDTGVAYKESEDGNTVAFISAGKLFSYQLATNKLVELYGFKGNDTFDTRAIFDQHGIKILDIDETGSVTFAVFGYMNSGRHEGEVGIQVYRFDNQYNTNEEIIYIPYEKSAEMLDSELDTLMYMNRNQNLYFTLENKVYCINLQDRTVQIRDDVEKNDTLVTSEDRRILISSRYYEGTDFAKSLVLTNLKTETEVTLSVPDGDAIMSMGFMGEDVIYGVAHLSDVKIESSGRLFFPMYRLVICDEEGKTLKNYEKEGYYVTAITRNDNQLTLDRVTIDDNGNNKEASHDYIATGEYGDGMAFTDATTIIDIYETYVQLQLPGDVNSSTLKYITPKEVVFEDGREIEIELQIVDRYYAYDAFGLMDIYNYAANAVSLSGSNAGWVYSSGGTLIWKKEGRSSKNQIMSISEEDFSPDKDSLAVCLDAMLSSAGVIRDSEYLLNSGKTVIEILEENLTDKLVVDLTGCELDSILYYVAKDIPVLVLLANDEAMLITGYNDTSLVLFDPVEGSLRKESLEDADIFFKEKGDVFITYVPY